MGVYYLKFFQPHIGTRLVLSPIMPIVYKAHFCTCHKQFEKQKKKKKKPNMPIKRNVLGKKMFITCKSKVKNSPS
jgi:hypothetical protein